MNIVSFVVAGVLFIAGIALFGYAWDGETFYWLAFVAGILVVSASVAIPFHLLKRVQG